MDRIDKHTAVSAALYFSIIGSVACNNDGQLVEEELWASTRVGKGDVYGEDSRLELNDPAVSTLLSEHGRSVAMVVNVRQILNYGDEKVTLSQQTMNQKIWSELGEPLCEDEPFRDQPAPGYCTAFLIGPDLVATAGHCVNGHTRCSKMAFAFGYAKESPDEEVTGVSREDFYRCEELIGRLYNPLEEREAIESREYWYDWAVMRLDRPVEGRSPLKLVGDERLRRGDEIAVIGHPSGIAMKVSSGVVVADDKERYINTTLDIYQGNSGSPALNPQTGEVEGIVIRGSGGKSFEVTDEGCTRSKRCEEFGAPGCTGNHVLRIDPVRVFTEEELRVIEQHGLEEDDDAPGFRTHYLFEEEAEVRFATVHLNAMARDSRKLRVLLHHNERSVG